MQLNFYRDNNHSHHHQHRTLGGYGLARHMHCYWQYTKGIDQGYLAVLIRFRARSFGRSIRLRLPRESSAWDTGSSLVSPSLWLLVVVEVEGGMAMLTDWSAGRSLLIAVHGLWFLDEGLCMFEHRERRVTVAPGKISTNRVPVNAGVGAATGPTSAARWNSKGAAECVALEAILRSLSCRTIKPCRTRELHHHRLQ